MRLFILLWWKPSFTNHKDGLKIGSKDWNLNSHRGTSKLVETGLVCFVVMNTFFYLRWQGSEGEVVKDPLELPLELEKPRVFCCCSLEIEPKEVFKTLDWKVLRKSNLTWFVLFLRVFHHDEGWSLDTKETFYKLKNWNQNLFILHQ